MEEGRNKKEIETTEEDTQEVDMEQYIETRLHELWEYYNHNPMKVVLFLEEMKAYWLVREIAEMCKYDGTLGSWLLEGIYTGIREDR